MERLSKQTRKNGEIAYYWRAGKDLIKVGFQPKCVRLHGTLEEIEARCRFLNAQARRWADETGKSAWDGKIKTLIKIYQTDKDSSFAELTPYTQIKTAQQLGKLCEAVGDRAVSKVTGADTSRWYKEMVGRGLSRGYAKAIVGKFKTALAYGVANRLEGCSELYTEMRAIRLQASPKRQIHLTYAQMRAFCAAAHEANRPSMALGMALQFCTGLRQRDVIGEWIRNTVAEAKGIHGEARDGCRVWWGGLTWAHIDAKMILRKVTSKTGVTVTHALREHPEVLEEILRCPRREGPVIIDESTALPYSPTVYRCLFRRIARSAGIPDEVWSMDARAGAVTEAREAGAEMYDVQAMTGHTKPAMTQHYDREQLEKTTRVARARRAFREGQP